MSDDNDTIEVTGTVVVKVAADVEQDASRHETESALVQAVRDGGHIETVHVESGPHAPELTELGETVREEYQEAQR